GLRGFARRGLSAPALSDGRPLGGHGLGHLIVPIGVIAAGPAHLRGVRLVARACDPLPLTAQPTARGGRHLAQGAEDGVRVEAGSRPFRALLSGVGYGLGLAAEGERLRALLCERWAHSSFGERLP